MCLFLKVSVFIKSSLYLYIVKSRFWRASGCSCQSHPGAQNSRAPVKIPTSVFLCLWPWNGLNLNTDVRFDHAVGWLTQYIFPKENYNTSSDLSFLLWKQKKLIGIATRPLHWRTNRQIKTTKRGSTDTTSWWEIRVKQAPWPCYTFSVVSLPDRHPQPKQPLLKELAVLWPPPLGSPPVGLVCQVGTSWLHTFTSSYNDGAERNKAGTCPWKEEEMSPSLCE